MKFTTAIFAIAAATGALAAPAAEIIEDRGLFSSTVTCKPKLAGKAKSFKVSLDTAKSEARRVGLAPGKSGDPHRYFAGDGIHWGVDGCDKASAILLEYPIYQVGKNAQWEENTLTAAQPGGPTPLRTVFANAAGGVIFCGVMTHSTVDAENRGHDFFERCT
ncbi:hypothetical protein NQ176_g2976 [Zarea fungicola]|uniref:Uncharacterized protein n=1 Tax=Zarea fungicola TaxID=93591 RepID=A0ACC1NKT7_9HYPO|nr:hypothetical protein NQ176_g2976 [Lecanicillium fungicola]